MKDDIDIEDVLKRSRIAPRPRVKRSVMSFFLRKMGEQIPPHKTSHWKRPVPLYFYLATVLTAVGLSFFAGTRLRSLDGRTYLSPNPAQPESTAVMQKVQLEVAPNDLL